MQTPWMCGNLAEGTAQGCLLHCSGCLSPHTGSGSRTWPPELPPCLDSTGTCRDRPPAWSVPVGSWWCCCLLWLDPVGEKQQRVRNLILKKNTGESADSPCSWGEICFCRWESLAATSESQCCWSVDDHSYRWSIAPENWTNNKYAIRRAEFHFYQQQLTGFESTEELPDVPEGFHRSVWVPQLDAFRLMQNQKSLI